METPPSNWADCQSQRLLFRLHRAEVRVASPSAAELRTLAILLSANFRPKPKKACDFELEASARI